MNNFVFWDGKKLLVTIPVISVVAKFASHFDHFDHFDHFSGPPSGTWVGQFDWIWCLKLFCHYRLKCTDRSDDFVITKKNYFTSNFHFLSSFSFVYITFSQLALITGKADIVGPGHCLGSKLCSVRKWATKLRLYVKEREDTNAQNVNIPPSHHLF